MQHTTTIIYREPELSYAHGIPWAPNFTQTRYPSRSELNDAFIYTPEGDLINRKSGYRYKYPSDATKYQRISYQNKSYAAHKCIAIMHLHVEHFEDLPYAVHLIQLHPQHATTVYSTMTVDHVSPHRHDNRIGNLRIISHIHNSEEANIYVEPWQHINSEVNRYCHNYLKDMGAKNA